MKLLRCPKCNKPVAYDEQLTDADIITCGCCDFSDYLVAFKNQAPTHGLDTTARPLTIDFLKEVYDVAANIETLNTADNIDGYVKKLCKDYNISPWPVINTLNAYLAARRTKAGLPNPLRFVRLESKTLMIESLQKSLADTLKSMPTASTAAAETPMAPVGTDDIWHERYNKLSDDFKKLNAKYDKLCDDYQTLYYKQSDQ